MMSDQHQPFQQQQQQTLMVALPTGPFTGTFVQQDSAGAGYIIIPVQSAEGWQHQFHSGVSTNEAYWGQQNYSDDITYYNNVQQQPVMYSPQQFSMPQDYNRSAGYSAAQQPAVYDPQQCNSDTQPDAYTAYNAHFDVTNAAYSGAQQSATFYEQSQFLSNFTPPGADTFCAPQSVEYHQQQFPSSTAVYYDQQDYNNEFQQPDMTHWQSQFHSDSTNSGAYANYAQQSFTGTADSGAQQPIDCDPQQLTFGTGAVQQGADRTAHNVVDDGYDGYDPQICYFPEQNQVNSTSTTYVSVPEQQESVQQRQNGNGTTTTSDGNSVASASSMQMDGSNSLTSQDDSSQANALDDINLDFLDHLLNVQPNGRPNNVIRNARVDSEEPAPPSINNPVPIPTPRAESLPDCWLDKQLEAWLDVNAYDCGFKVIVRWIHSQQQTYQLPAQVFKYFGDKIGSENEHYRRHAIGVFRDMGTYDILLSKIFLQIYGDDSYIPANRRRVVMERPWLAPGLSPNEITVFLETIVGFCDVMTKCRYFTFHFDAEDDGLSPEFCSALLKRAEKAGAIQPWKEKHLYEWLGRMKTRRNVQKMPFFENGTLPNLMEAAITSQINKHHGSFDVDSMWLSVNRSLMINGKNSFVAGLSNRTVQQIGNLNSTMLGSGNSIFDSD